MLKSTGLAVGSVAAPHGLQSTGSIVVVGEDRVALTETGKAASESPLRSDTLRSGHQGSSLESSAWGLSARNGAQW